MAGTGSNTLILPERGGAWSRVFLHATAGPATTWDEARDELGLEECIRTLLVIEA